MVNQTSFNALALALEQIDPFLYRNLSGPQTFPITLSIRSGDLTAAISVVSCIMQFNLRAGIFCNNVCKRAVSWIVED